MSTTTIKVGDRVTPNNIGEDSQRRAIDWSARVGGGTVIAVWNDGCREPQDVCEVAWDAPERARGFGSSNIPVACLSRAR